MWLVTDLKVCGVVVSEVNGRAGDQRSRYTRRQHPYHILPKSWVRQHRSSPTIEPCPEAKQSIKWAEYSDAKTFFRF